MAAAGDDKTWLAEAIIANRRRRREELPAELFGEHAWEAMLHLFVADARGAGLKGGDLADLVGRDRPIMSRWIRHLSAVGMIAGDGSGELDVLLVPSPEALHAIERYLADAQRLARDFIARDHGG